MDDKGRLQWHSQHLVHINYAEALALWKALLLAPYQSAVWTDSAVAFAWIRRAKKGWQISAMISLVALVKNIMVC